LQAGLISGLLREHRRRQLAEVQARQRMAELAHVNRFSTAGELTASIAHEINQPLGSILTNAETAQAILKSPNPDIVELNEIVDDIVRDDRRASEVIRRMKSLLTKAPFELKSLDLNDVARETVEFLSSLAIGRKVELLSVIRPDALQILGDRVQLQQVILNLVVNGIDAMKDTGSEVRTISIRTSRVENFAELSVSDRGAGIPEDQLKGVFEPFYTSKAGGMGMGLSIARTIIEAHDGLISAKNRGHGGASFRIKLPLSMEAIENGGGSNDRNSTTVKPLATSANQISDSRKNRLARFRFMTLPYLPRRWLCDVSQSFSGVAVPNGPIFGSASLSGPSGSRTACSSSRFLWVAIWSREGQD
jgi:C4-dicarboxylate-specific signal transduction histidine kinase